VLNFAGKTVQYAYAWDPVRGEQRTEVEIASDKGEWWCRSKTGGFVDRHRIRAVQLPLFTGLVWEEVYDSNCRCMGDRCGSALRSPANKT
jgi:hypothetical protein